MFGNTKLDKITSNNRLSSTFLLLAILIAGCILIIYSNNNKTTLYLGSGCVIFVLFLSYDAYCKVSMSEHYENIIEQKDKILTIKQNNILPQNEFKEKVE